MDSNRSLLTIITKMMRTKCHLSIGDTEWKIVIHSSKGCQMICRPIGCERHKKSWQLDGVSKFNSKLSSQIEEIIAQNKDKFEITGDIEITTPMLKKVKVAVDDKSALNCTIARHYPCTPLAIILFFPAFFGFENVASILDKTLQFKYTKANLMEKSS